jgi:hypothetical protein
MQARVEAGGLGGVARVGGPVQAEPSGFADGLAEERGRKSSTWIQVLGFT